jgi:hypothetical protein
MSNNPTIPAGHKKCSKPTCKQPVKPISEFTKNNQTPDKKHWYCKTCCKEWQANTAKGPSLKTYLNTQQVYPNTSLEIKELFYEKKKKKDGTEYRNKILIAKVWCTACQKFQNLTAEYIKRGKQFGCSKRCLFSTSNRIREKNAAEFKERSIAVHGEKYTYDKVDYKNSDTDVTITCPLHGDFQQRASAHLKGRGCYECWKERMRTSVEEFWEAVKKNHKADEYSYPKFDEEYTKSGDKITIFHTKCGKEFRQEAGSHMTGIGCSRCNSSKGEKDWLDYLNIPDDSDQRQVTIHVQGTNGKKKRFLVDGLDRAKCSKEFPNGTVYEYHGDYYHGNPMLHDPKEVNRVNRKTMGELFQRTCTKHQLIKNGGYDLQWIWESQWLKISKP